MYGAMQQFKIKRHNSISAALPSRQDQLMKFFYGQEQIFGHFAASSFNLLTIVALVRVTEFFRLSIFVFGEFFAEFSFYKIKFI